MDTKSYVLYTDRCIKTMFLVGGDYFYVVAFYSVALSLPMNFSSLRFAGIFPERYPADARLKFDIHSYKLVADTSLF